MNDAVINNMLAKQAQLIGAMATENTALRAANATITAEIADLKLRIETLEMSAVSKP